MNRQASTDLARYVFLGAVTYALGLVALRAADHVSFLASTFPHFLVAVAATKLLGDTVYFLLSPRRRLWVYVDDYLGNDFMPFFRYGFPLAIIQAYLLNRGYVPPAYLGLWLGPGSATLIYLIDRWLVERAQDGHERAGGGVPVVRGRQDP